MEHLYESVLIDTVDGFQCKVFSNNHPEGKIIVKPKYIPEDKANFTGLKKRFFNQKAVYRFHLFSKKEIVKNNLEEFKKIFPDYFYEDPNHQNWFLVVPKEKVKKIYDCKKGLKELLKIPEEDLDDYLKSVVGLINLLLKSGISIDNLGINHSTLIGNYTPGKSDIDIVVYGKDNGWKVIHFLEKAKHPSLKWKTEEDWRRYYKDRIVSKNFSEEEYIKNMVQKKDDGFFNNHVFSIFCVEEPEECWYSWKDIHTPLGIVKVKGIVKEDYNSIVRPGFYELENSKVIEGKDVPIKRVVTWSRPFSLQAKKGEEIEAVGLLEEVTSEKRDKFYQVVIGYFDTYVNDRGEKEYIKKIIK